jgi:hypothetical protein
MTSALHFKVGSTALGELLHASVPARAPPATQSRSVFLSASVRRGFGDGGIGLASSSIRRTIRSPTFFTSAYETSDIGAPYCGGSEWQLRHRDARRVSTSHGKDPRPTPFVPAGPPGADGASPTPPPQATTSADRASGREIIPSRMIHDRRPGKAYPTLALLVHALQVLAGGCINFDPLPLFDE